MIQLYNKGQTDFSKKGITLNAQTASVTYTDNGRFDLDLTMPVPENISFDYGMIIRCSVPEQHIPEITLGTVSYYTVSNAEGSTLWSVVPTLKRVYYKQWIGYSQTEGVHEYSVGDKVTYLNNNYRCTYFDSESQVATVPPNNSSWWERISNTTGQAGKAAAEVEYGDVIMKTGDFNDEYMEAATTNGKTGYILIADVTATGETETRTIPAQTITAQNFTITEIEKTSDGKQVTIHAEHVSYGLGRTMLGDCNLVGVNPATAVLFIQGAMKETYSGGIYTNLSDELSITANWSWKNAQNAILDPKAGLLQYTAGQMIRNDLDVFLIEKGAAVPKYAVKYGTNLTAVKWDGSVTGIVTRIYPTAQTADGDTLLLPEEHIDTVRVVPFIRPEVLNTGLKVGAKEKQSDGTEIELTEDIIYTRMREAAYNRFNIDECDKIDITLEVDWIHLPDTEEYKDYAALQNAAPGEWVQVTAGPLGINELIQLTGYTYDPILEKYKKATFGKNKVSPGVASYDLQTGAVSGRALAAGAVGSQNIMAEAITAREIEAGSITAEKIASRSITAEIIAANAITADAINAGAVTAEKIAAHAITAQQIAAHAITADEIAAGAITADAIASGVIQAQHIAALAITTEKLAAGAVEADKIAAGAVTTAKLAAGAVTAEKIAAGAITAAKIDTTDLTAINATLGTATIADARIALADIDFAKVKDLNAESAYFGQAVFQEALGGKLYVPRLAANYAQIVNATISDLVIQATNDNFYKLDVDLAGNVTATQITPSAQEISDGHTADGRTIYLGTDIVASDLNTMNIYASHALMDEITANILNVDKLFAREATISRINALDLSSNTYIQSTIGNWLSGSTITQTIASLDSRIASLGYGTVYMQPEEPDHNHLTAGDIWIQTMSDGSWEEIYESYDSWEQIYNDVSSWQVLGSVPKMWVWDGNKFQLMYDALLPTTVETEIQQLATAITLKASQSAVDILSGEVSEFAATLTVQAQEIEAAVSAVNAKAASYVMWIDPTTIYSVSLGDIWIKRDAEGFCDQTTWEDLYDNFDSWEAFYEYHDAWCDMLGDRTFVWNGTEWLETSDRAAEIYQKTLIDQNTTSVTILAESTATLEGNMITVQAALTVANDRITQEVERATTAEAGKIEKTTQIQTVDQIISEAVRQSASSASGLYIAKTTSYQSADAIVQTAETYAAGVASAAEAAAKGASIAKTTQLQTADAIVNEAVRQSGVNAANGYIAKTSTYQSADAIVSTAQSYASSVASAAESNAKSYAATVAGTAETNAKNASIAKTEQYQSAAAIVSTAETYAAGVANTAETNAKNYAAGVAGTAETNAKNASIPRTTGYSSVADIIATAESLASAAQAGAEGNCILRTTQYQSASAIVLAAESYTDTNAYAKVSGIGITAAGVDISGSQYVNIASGGWFKVTTGDFLIDTSVGATGYVILSGSTTAANAGFRLKKNGELTITKLMALDANGNETEVNLRTSGLWKLAYKTVNAVTTSGGYCTAMSFSDGSSVNFKTAASVTLTGAWSGNTFTVSNSGNAQTSATTVEFGSTLASIAAYLFTAQDHKATMTVKDNDRNKTVLTETYDATALYNSTYNKGWNECRDACTLLERYTRESTATGSVTHYLLYNGNYIDIGTGWYRVNRADAYARPAEKE